MSVISKVCFCKMLIFGNPLQCTYMSTYSYKNISTNKYDEKELMKVRKGAKSLKYKIVLLGLVLEYLPG